MPYSDTSLRPWILEQLQQRGCQEFTSVVDVGCGDGSAVESYWPSMPRSRWTGVEVWEPYAERFGLRGKYHELVIKDVRQFHFPPRCDLVIFGDVLEHMPELDAIALWNRARIAARWLVLGIPVICMPQDEWEGNPHEAHVSTWSTSMVLDLLGGIDEWDGNGTVGAFIAHGEKRQR